MKDHERTRKLLPLLAAGAANSDEKETVEAHVAGCSACATEFDNWKRLAIDIRLLPTPQPSSELMQRVHSRVASELARNAEREWNRRMLAFLVLFAWAAMLWPGIFGVAGGLQRWFGPYTRLLIIAVVGYTTVAALISVVAAAVLNVKQRTLTGESYEPLSR